MNELNILSVRRGLERLEVLLYAVLCLGSLFKLRCPMLGCSNTSRRQ